MDCRRKRSCPRTGLDRNRPSANLLTLTLRELTFRMPNRSRRQSSGRSASFGFRAGSRRALQKMQLHHHLSSRRWSLEMVKDSGHREDGHCLWVVCVASDPARCRAEECKRHDIARAVRPTTRGARCGRGSELIGPPVRSCVRLAIGTTPTRSPARDSPGRSRQKHAVCARRL